MFRPARLIADSPALTVTPNPAPPAAETPDLIAKLFPDSRFAESRRRFVKPWAKTF